MVNNKDDFEVLSNILDSRSEAEKIFVEEHMGSEGVSTPSVKNRINDGKSLKIVRSPKIVLSAKVTKRKKTFLKEWNIVVAAVAISVVVAVVGFSENVFGKQNDGEIPQTSASSTYFNSDGEEEAIEEESVDKGITEENIIPNDDINEKVISTEISDTIVGENVNINKTIISQNEWFWNVGCADDIDDVRDFLNNTEEGYYIRMYSQIYGVDPSIIAAMCKVESISLNHEDCIPGGKYYNGYGVGLMQFESPDVNTGIISGTNVLTGDIDSVDLNMDSALDKEQNIKMGVMSFQNNLYAMDGNIYLAILCHNFGEPMVELILRENNLWDTRGDITDVRWRDIMKDAHFNPNKYLSYDYWPLENGNYGAEDYVGSVLRYCEQDVSYYYNGDNYNVDLVTMQVSQQQIAGRTM